MILKSLGVVLLLLFIAVIWIAYNRISKMSYAADIEHDPFRRPNYILCWITTIGCLSVVSDILFEWKDW